MINNVQDLKDFIIWAKTQKIAEFTLGLCHIKFAAGASSSVVLEPVPTLTDEEIEKQAKQELEEITFYSSQTG